LKFRSNAPVSRLSGQAELETNHGPRRVCDLLAVDAQVAAGRSGAAPGDVEAESAGAPVAAATPEGAGREPGAAVAHLDHDPRRRAGEPGADLHGCAVGGVGDAVLDERVQG